MYAYSQFIKQKPTQYSKAIILELKKKNLNASLKKLLNPDLQEDLVQLKTPCSHDLALIFITSLLNT